MFTLFILNMTVQWQIIRPVSKLRVTSLHKPHHEGDTKVDIWWVHSHGHFTLSEKT
jgi:hypothetical protein